MKKLLMAKLIAVLLVGTAAGQVSNKVQAFAVAIAKAEGFYTRGTIPNRYSNPGDLKCRRGERYPGQIGIGKAGHVIFRTKADGWAALDHQINKAMAGDSKFYNPMMTFRQVAKKYAGNYRVWLANVTRELGVSPNDTLYDFFNMDRRNVVTEYQENGQFDLLALNLQEN